MLASLLPGLREIRAPLISGYVWLVFLYLAFYDDLPDRADSSSVLQPAFELGDQLSAFGIAAISGVAAYLIGSAVQELLKLAGRLISPRRPLYGEAGTHLSRAGFRDIRNFVHLRIEDVRRRLFQLALSPGERGIDEEPTPWVVERELPLVRTLLLGERPELVREVDRLQAEADLRITVAFPLVFLSIFLAARASPGWLVVIPPALLLVAQGYQRQREAGDLLAKALRIGKANAPALESLEASADAALERSSLEEELDKRQDDRHPMTEFRLGCLKASGEEFEAALVCFRFAAENGVIRAYAELGSIHERREEFDPAESAYRDGDARGDRKARLLLSKLLSRLARDEEALEAARRELQVDDEEAPELDLEISREGARIASYRSRMDRGDAKAALNLGLLLARRKDLAGASKAFRKAIELNPADAQAWSELGAIASDQGKFDDAFDAEQRALELQEAQLGPSHLIVATTLGNQGATALSLGRYELAKELLERALGLAEEQGASKFHIAVVMGNLGETLLSLGDFERARELMERALTLKEQGGADKRSIAMTLGHLGGLLHVEGKLGRSQATLQRALAMKEEQLGPDHYDVAIALVNLGLALDSRGHFEQGKELVERGLATKERLGADQLGIAITRGNLGLVLASLGQYERARELLEAALKAEEQVGSSVLPVTGTSIELAGVLSLLGEHQRARGLLEDALHAREELLGPDHLFNAGALMILGEVLVQLGEAERAVQVQRQGLSIVEGQVGDDHFMTADALALVGDSLREAGHLSESEEVLSRACAIGGAAKEQNLPDLAKALRAYGRTLGAQGRLDKARAEIELAISMQKETIGSHHPEMAKSLDALAAILEEAGEAGLAQTAKDEAAEIRDSGPDGG